jgi:hypothetical protein
MTYRKYHHNNSSPEVHDSCSSHSKRFFFWPFKRKEKTTGRTGALHSSEVKKIINEIGIGKQIEILRVGYDGGIDDMPVLVEILDISSHGFTGRIINLERQMIESATKNLVYAKKGGGVLEFSFDDGDIKEISVSQDEELLQQERNIENLKEILTALDTGDHIIVAYYDEKRKGTINTEGLLTEKNDSNEAFSLQIEKINRIELEKKITKKFDINQDLVIDIEIV